ncbi:MAG: aminotransferase class V-fold PLP-dependent enzyme [Endozoicomonadaceae bacterium]|nr:aminotransferase class V-fold PLP-dependent enzyme [Endozoicomonadaceae bacterium]
MLDYRADFSIFNYYQQINKTFVYLNNAETTHKPRVVIEALTDFYTQSNINVNRSLAAIHDKTMLTYEASRWLLKSFVNAKYVEEIIWTHSATASINLVANSWAASHCMPGDEILITQMEHHSNWLPWFQLQKKYGIMIKITPVTETGSLNIKEFYKLLNVKTKLVSITHVSNATGCLNPVKDMIQAAHSVGAMVLIDGAQAIAHMPVDVIDLACDFYVFSAHKMYAPMGIGALYAKKEHLDSMPPWQTGGGMVVDYHENHEVTWNAIPFKFEAGTPNVASIIGWGAAIHYLNQCNRSQIAQDEATLLQYFKQQLSQLKGLRVICDESHYISIVSVQLDRLNHYDMHQLLLEEGVWIRSGHHCAIPFMKAMNWSGTLRFSLALYNTKADIDLCLEKLDSILKHRHSLCVIPEKPLKPVNAICLDALKTLSTMKNWSMRYRLLMQLSQSLPCCPEHIKQPHYLIPDCEQQVWFAVQLDTHQGILRVCGDSDSQIMKGLIMILVDLFDQKSCVYLQSIAFDAFHQFKFLTDLTATRLLAWQYMLNQIKSLIDLDTGKPK